MDTIRLKATGLKKEYLRRRKDTNILCAVHSCDLELRAGEWTLLSGRSGSGKTTLLQMLAGLLRPTEGMVFWNDMQDDLYALPDDERSALRNRMFGFVPQANSALSSLTVIENILLPLRFRQDSEKQEHPAAKEEQEVAAERAKSLMERLELGHLSDEKVSALSGGELRRMSIARALILKPSVIFADEPTSDLDEQSTLLIFSLFREAVTQGAALLMVSHDKEAVSVADRLLLMDAGHLRNG